MLTRLTGGTIYDPANGVDGEVRDLYVRDGNKIRLAIHDGDLLTGSLTTSGFATAVHPDWSAMSPLERPAAKVPLEKAV